MTGPKEGIYLDAALRVVEQQVDERIDRIVDRRRRFNRGLIAALAATTLVGAAATAAALTVTPLVPTDPPVRFATAELHCVDGGDAGASAYFTVRYRIAETEASRVDRVALCLTARATLAGSDDLVHAEPAQLLEAAATIVRSAVVDDETADESTPAARVELNVEEASFGALRLPAQSSVVGGVCERVSDGRLVILTLRSSGAPTTPAGWAAQCRASDGYGPAATTGPGR